MSGHFRDVIRRMRRAAGLSQAELANRLSTTQSAVARWESGDVSPRLDNVRRIADACGLDAHITWALRRSSGQAERVDVDRDQIRRHLSWTPERRLDNLLEMLAFEALAHRARRIGPASSARPAP